jgi:hypothetical protein
MAALKPVGINTVVSTSVTSTQTSAFSQQSDALRVVAETAGVYVAIGTNPTATNENYYVSTNETETITIGPIASQRVVGITTGSTTIVDFPEGTGCPFAVGDAVSLTVNGQSAFDFSHKIVIDVNATSDRFGYFNTRATIDHDSSSGNPSALTAPYAELRKSIKVAVKTESGTGKAYIQQVQDS